MSTTDAIATLIDDIGLNHNNNNLTLCTFIDFSKAFDTLNHKLIINQLGLLNMNTAVINWFNLYLLGRRQVVVMNGHVSTEKSILTGVPQGLVLGPLLFLIYVNSLANLKLNASLIMYADDTVVYSPVSKNITQQEILKYQKDLNEIGEWCLTNRLSINVGKTKLMILGRTRGNVMDRALRIIYFYDCDISIACLHSRAKILTLELRAKAQLLCLMFSRSFDQEKYPPINPSRTTRATERTRFYIPRPKNEKFKLFPLYQGAHLWDQLPQETQQTDSYLAFKNEVKRFLENKGN